MKMKAEEIAEKARKSISSFCFNECKAYCCRKGYLRLSYAEMDVVTKGKRKTLEDKKTLKTMGENSYSLYIGDHGVGCPSLEDHKCTIHKDPGRPAVCKNFPLFIEGDTLRLSNRCLAVKNGMLYPYIVMLLRSGLKLSKNEEYQDFDFESFEKDLNINEMEV